MRASNRRLEGNGSTPIPSLQVMHDTAGERFKAHPSKCYQRHIRELYAKTEKREPIASLSGAHVEAITNEEASTIILKYEWLRTMGSGTVACYGLKLNGELLGVACFSVLGGRIRRICVAGTEEETKELESATVCLCRGACVPWAPSNAASFLIRWACKCAYKERDWKIFFAYSDSDAGEIGTVYQAVGWYFIGDNFRKGKYHTDYQSPDGKTIWTSYKIHHQKISRAQLLRDGWKPIRRYGKKKWVWFEGERLERAYLKSLCRYPFLPYPKREIAA